ncbi:septal ring lytic transglycosylase RlpA family protein [Stutzerimonas tarimensis]|uniref:Endolytic peptidoglycan transglycosylase RlpA n=1 Tax=Stutzerimonas tarimensis TaxID=1507735 RepID=A0ABV7T605_9GAMM
MIARHAALLTLCGALVLLAGCAGKRAPEAPAATGAAAVKPYPRPNQDGAPWWDVDVSQIPDAVPTPHYGPYKASPYRVLGKDYYPIPDARGYSSVGTASWYGTKFHGQATANGEEYDLYGMTAAHKTLPLPSYVRVTNLENNKVVILRVNDRGPFYSDRIIDLSFAAAKKLDFAERGVARVKVEAIDPERWWADQGRPVPKVMAQPRQVAAGQPASVTPQEYTPPAQQHAGAVVPAQVSGSGPLGAAQGVFLQVGAFANPDAAELLKDKLGGVVDAPVFISSVVHNQQVLHRVRLGPIKSAAEASRLEDSLRLAQLGNPRRVMPD